MLVMDYIQGESLDKVIARTGAQSVEQVLEWGMQICDVFHYLHNQPTPIIYRDMKPANVMLQPDGQLMMIDFGTARTQKIGVEMQADTICIGTAGFAAPEQFGGIGQSTARTDIFCLGATLYNMVTGHSPCERPMGILPLEHWNPALANTPIAEIIYKCTRNDPNERYQTAWELHEDLRLASIGAFGKGKSGSLGGGLRKLDWQRQDVRDRGMIAEGLSGLLHRAKTGLTGTLQQEETTESQPTAQKGISGQLQVHGTDWQKVQAQGEVSAQLPQNLLEQQQEKALLQQKLILVAMLIAGIFVVLTLVLLLLQQIGAAIVFLIISLIAAGCGVVGLLTSRGKQ